MADGRATNVRVHVQLKGTESQLNADGSLSIGGRRKNLNYLLMQPHSVYVAYHVPSGSLRVRTAECIARQYEHGGANWTIQQTLTAPFVEELSPERLDWLPDLICASARASLERRVSQVGLSAVDQSIHVLDSPPDVHVPEEPVLARELLTELYEKHADEEISASFAKFAAVFGAVSDDMGVCYMAEREVGSSAQVQISQAS